jgi:probable rRNA maturation factor
VSRDPATSKSTSAQTLSRFATRVQNELGIVGEVSVAVTSNREMQALNRRFRKKNKPTDVLTFPPARAGTAGDIAISLEIAAANAAELRHSLATEVKVLILHGMLHLAGYDHEIDDGEMHAREAELRKKFKLPVGLIERAHGAASGEKATKRGGRRA